MMALSTREDEAVEQTLRTQTGDAEEVLDMLLGSKFVSHYS